MFENIKKKNFQGVSTIKKSYSLSDLSETDGSDIMMREELIPVKHRARPSKMTTSLSSISTRSSSLSKRPTSEIYFPEVEFKDASRKGQDYR